MQHNEFRPPRPTREFNADLVRHLREHAGRVVDGYFKDAPLLVPDVIGAGLLSNGAVTRLRVRCSAPSSSEYLSRVGRLSGSRR
jgi:hypothetical protein